MAEEVSEPVPHGFLSQAIDAMGDGIIIIDTAGRLIHMNQALKKLTGHDLQSLQAAGGLQALYADEVHLEDLLEWAPAGEVDERELTLVTAGADRIPISLRMSSVHDEHGVGIGVCCVHRDLRPQKSERARAQRYLDLAGAVIVVLDREGRITLLNRAGGELLGVSPDEVVGEVWFDRFLPAPMRDAVWEVFRRLMESREEPEAARFENPVVTATGQERTILWHNVVLRDAAGNPSGALSSGQDITERIRREAEQKKLEQRMLQAQKMESLALLAGGIAHDFNNLLASIMGNASLALLDLSPMSPAREIVEDIVLAATRAADLAKQMLAYSGKGQLVVACVDCSELIEEMSHLLRTNISRKIVLCLDLARELPPVSVDVTQLRQVLMNLLTNAADAIGDRSGVVSITTGASEIPQEYLDEITFTEEALPGMFIYIEVSDTGSGMDAETQSKIFDPFFSTKFAGRGLGLAAVQGIVRTHGGAIKVYSEEGRGTTMKVLLPIVEGAVDALESALTSQGEGET